MESMTIQSALSAYPLLQLDPSTSPCLAEQTSLFLQSIQLSAEPVSVTNDMTTLLALVAGERSRILPTSVRHFCLPK